MKKMVIIISEADSEIRASLATLFALKGESAETVEIITPEEHQNRSFKDLAIDHIKEQCDKFNLEMGQMESAPNPKHFRGVIPDKYKMKHNRRK